MQGLEKLGEGQLSGPEDVYVDAAAGGTLYTATRDGWLQRMQPNGTWERWRFAGGAGLLGIAPSADGSMLVCDAYKVSAGGSLQGKRRPCRVPPPLAARRCTAAAQPRPTASAMACAAAARHPLQPPPWPCFTPLRCRHAAASAAGPGRRSPASHATRPRTYRGTQLDHGLVRVEEGRVTILASTVEGSPIRFAEAVIEASDGTVYFSDGSTRFGIDQWFLDYLEASSTGRLLKYEPSTGKVSVVLDNLAFANGVALSQEETFVVVCESWGYRCSKLWLKGDKAGKAETFIDNLPGSPDNIHLAPDGSLWIALLQLRSPWIDLVTRWTFTKRVASSFPTLLDMLKETGKGAMVAQVSENGKIVRVLSDSEGKETSFITSVTEYDGNLYFGSMTSNFIGKMSLAKVPCVQEAVS
uniref:Uncharacterized protein n=1 Tax=Avena sativa TaxID=4498 RepID=A0ACD5ZG37_AVESA